MSDRFTMEAIADLQKKTAEDRILIEAMTTVLENMQVLLCKQTELLTQMHGYSKMGSTHPEEDAHAE